MRSVVHRIAWAAAAGLGVLAFGQACDNGPSTPSSEPVAAVYIAPGTDTALVGHNLQFTARLECQHGHVLQRAIQWRSSDPTIARLSSTGYLTAVAPGQVTVTAKSEGIEGQAVVLVLTPVARITVAPASSSILPGETVQLAATAMDANGAALNRQAAWSSSNPAIATVDGNGLVTGTAVGQATITATLDGVVGSATVVVRAPVGSIVVTPAASTVIIGHTLQLTATVRDAAGAVLDRPVTWTSNNTSVVVVDATGLATAVAEGMATVTAFVEGRTAVAAITVKPPVNAVSVTPAVATLDVGEALQLNATLYDFDGTPLDRPVTWSTSDPAVVEVTPTGRITAKAPGTAAVSATSEGKVGTADVTVLVPVALVAVTPASAELDVGQTLQLTAIPKDAAGNPLNRPVAWLSSNPAVATVDGSGFVEAVGEGSATVTATARGQTGTASLTVWVPVASVGINPASATLAPGATLPLSASVKDAQGNVLDRPVTWLSADPSIASVDASGLLAAQAPGTVTITATARGVTGQGTYTVQMPVAAVRVQPASDTLSVGQTAQLAAALEDAAGNPLNRPVVWSTSDPTVATVDGNGLVTGVAVGSATVSATSEGIQGHAAITVRVAVGSVVITDPGTDPLEVGLTLQLSATVLDVDGNQLTDRPLTWSSSDTMVATVDDTGLVTGAGRGTATISATAEGKTASVSIRVVGEASTLGNNLSYPVVFSEGIGITGLEAALDPGIRPTAAEGITADTVPFFYEGNVPDYGTYYLQQGLNVWRAEWLDGGAAGVQGTEVGWGDNLTHQTWTTHSVIRIEVGLNAYTTAPLRGFNMAVLYGTGATEMQGTDGTVATFVPTVYAVTPRLTIQLLDSLTMQPVYTLFDGSIWEGLAAGGGSGVFSAEVNVGGKIVYGYNLMLQSAVLPSQYHKYGWWRLTFRLDDQAQLGGATIPRNTSLDRLVASTETLLYQPEIDPASNTSWVDIYIQSAKGGSTP